MSTARNVALLAGLSIMACATPVSARGEGFLQAEAQALDIAMKSMAMRSVAGQGNRTPQVAGVYKSALVAAGWADGDVEITPLEDTAYIIATWKGSDPALAPLVISGHMDVVEARREDWERDPFVPVVEDGVLYGRGASDMKLGGAIAVSSLIQLRRQGFRPRRTIVIEFSGDEETAMKTSAAIADKLAGAEMVINADGGGGTFDEESGKPLYWVWSGAEKTYADYRLEVTDPGGHSSAPRPVNAIVELSKALAKIGAYRFAPELSPVTKGYFEKAAPFERDAVVASAMRAFAANPRDEGAIATLRAHPSTVGKIGTTCVPTMVDAGHALNALPQRATANVNCRIFPGHPREEILAELRKAVGMDGVKITDVSEGSVATAASPMRADFLAAAEKAIAMAWGKGITVIPSQSSGASDSMYFRARNIPSYGASPMFSKDSESFSQGLNERARISNIRPGITYYVSLITDLAK